MRPKVFLWLHAAVAMGMVMALPAPRSPAARATSFGVMVGGRGMNALQRTAVAKQLGATWFRSWTIDLRQWKGRSADAETAIRAGFHVVPSITNGGGAPGPDGRPRPAVPPADLASYKADLGRAIDTCKLGLVVVENEENSALCYAGTPEQYGAQLKAAVEVAHARGVPCTNGGLGSGLVVLLVWDGYRSRGDTARADSFLRRAFTPQQVQTLRQPTGQRIAQQQLATGRALLKAYRDAHADYVNFHWYAADPGAFEEAVRFLREQTGLQPMCGEMGQPDANPAAVTALLARAVQLRLPLVVWNSVDGRGAALQEANGALRPSGRAFQAAARGRTQGAKALAAPGAGAARGMGGVTAGRSRRGGRDRMPGA